MASTFLCTVLTQSSYWRLHPDVLHDSKGNISSIQCKMSLGGPKSMRKVDDVSLILIDFYVAASTLRLNSSETSLQLSENITLFVVCRIYTGVVSRDLDGHHVLERIIYMCILYNMGGRLEPCGTPACISVGVDISLPSTETLNFLWERKELISLIRLIQNFNSDNLYSKQRCHISSKVFSVSKNTVTVDMLLLKFKAPWSVSLIHWSIVL
jgi:hypothetical protein